MRRNWANRVETVLSVYAHEWAAAKGDDLGDLLGAARGPRGWRRTQLR